MSKAQQFRELLNSAEPEFLMEAHSGLSARIVEEAGFKGIWASSLSISAALGVRDNNEASWTQVLEICEFMADATQIPILVDGDTGYGNFNNMRRLVHKLEQRDVAAVCIEDKLFPKTNSLISGDRHPLADMDEFAGKIKAAKDGQSGPDFSVVARLEAFIAGWGLDEMLRRAEAYCDAGADALLIHSKCSTPDQVLAFAQAWSRPVPLVIVPTTYYGTPVEVYSEAGISLVIWANHNLRASVRAMQETCRQIREEQSVQNVEDQVVPVREVFRLQDAQELMEAEERYLPKRQEPARGIVLGAAHGDELRELTRDRPKTMVTVGGRPLLHRLVDQFRKEDIRDILVIRGFGRDQVHAPDVTFVDNEDFAGTGELYTLDRAYEHLRGDLVVAYGDILFRKYILHNLLNVEDDIAVVVDTAWRQRPSFNGSEDFVRTTEPHSLKYGDTDVWLSEMDPALPEAQINGEWIGLFKTTTRGSDTLRAAIDELRAHADFSSLQLYALFNHLVASGRKVRVIYITGHWLDVDNLEDLAEAQVF